MKYLVLLSIVLCAVVSSFTQTIIWIGGTGNWNVAANWDSGTIPQAGEDVLISNADVTIPNNYNAICRTVDLRSDATLNITSTASLTCNFEDPTGIGTVIIIDVDSSAFLYNYGSINTSSSTEPVYWHIFVSGVFTNYDGANVTMDFDIGSPSALRGAIYCDNIGVINNNEGASIQINSDLGPYQFSLRNRGVFNNYGTIQIYHSTQSGTGIINGNEFTNHETGSILVENTSTGIDNDEEEVGYGFFDNYGEVSIQNSSFYSLDCSHTAFNNYTCATFKTNTKIYDYPPIDIYNYGWFITTATGVTYFEFVNQGVVQDLNGHYPYLLDFNEDVAIIEIPGDHCVGSIITEPIHFATGYSNSNFSIVDWYTDEEATIDAGDFDEVNETFTPNSNAGGLDMLYVVMHDITEGCEYTFKVAFENPITPTITIYLDADNDSYGDPDMSIESCSLPNGYVTNNQDCDDSDPNEYPGQIWFLDNDLDGFSTGSNIIQCERPAGNYFLSSELINSNPDCDDNDANEFPGQIWYEDIDNDGYSSGVNVTQCERPIINYYSENELTGTQEDCDDNNNTVYPGAQELCDGLDNNCDDFIDEGCEGYICNIPIEIAGIPYNYSGTTSGFDDDYDENDGCSSSYMTGDDIVFKLTPASNQVIRIKLTKTAGPNDYSAHAVFLLDNCPDEPGANCIAFKQHSASSSVNEPIYIETALLTAGQTYYIVVSSHGAYHQHFDFDLEIDEPLGAVCQNANQIAGIPYSYSGSTQFLGDDYDDADGCASSYMTGNDVVFKFTPNNEEVIRIKLTKTAGPNDYSAHAVFLLDACPNDISNNCIAFKQHSASSSVNEPVYIETAQLTAGQTYYIVVSSHGAYHQHFDFNLEIDEPFGSICQNANQVSGIPYSYSGSTQFLGDDYDDSDGCASVYMTGNEVVFTFTPNNNQVIRIKLTKTAGPNDYSAHGLFLLDACPDDLSNNCIAFNKNSASSSVNEPVYIETAQVTAGQTYYIVVSSYGVYHQYFDFDLEIDNPTGNICENAEPISLPYIQTAKSTCFFGNDYDNTDACTSNYMNGNDYVYFYSPDIDELINIEVTNQTENSTGVFLIKGCPDNPNAECVASANSSGGNSPLSISDQEILANENYFIIVASLGLPEICFDYDISIESGGPLPLDLLSFEAHLKNDNSVGLFWETENERNVQHFEIMRSTDGTDWEIIALQQAMGNNELITFYNYVDISISDYYLQPEHWYYRLKMVDNDRSFRFSDIKSVKPVQSHQENNFIIFPNPISNTQSLSIKNVFPERNNNFNVLFYNTLGQLQYSEKVDNQADELTNIKLPDHIKPGLLLIQIRKNNRVLFSDRIIFLTKE